MFVGEIGIPRRDFLYEIKHWEAFRIYRGYCKRNRLIQQLIAENVYSTTFSMRDPNGKRVQDLYPQLWETDEEEDMQPPLSDEDYEREQNIMRMLNEQLQEQRKNS